MLMYKIEIPHLPMAIYLLSNLSINYSLIERLLICIYMWDSDSIYKAEETLVLARAKTN